MAKRRFDQNTNRVDYGELLVADVEYELDQAVCLTYSLDMEALLGIPICLGMKGENTRNFEAGVLSSNKDFVKNAAEQFDSVWMGAHCKGCRRKEFCGDPIGVI